MRLRRLFLPFLIFVSLDASAQFDRWENVELEGIYVFGHATSALTPCWRERPMWLDGVGKGADDLDDAYETLAKADFDPLFVVVRGKLAADRDNGDFLGWFVIEELVEFSADPDVISNCQSQARTK